MRLSHLVPCLLVLGASPRAFANEWRQLGADALRSRDTSEKAGPTFSPAWTYAVPGSQIVASPVIVDGTVVVGAMTGEIDALTRDGHESWKQTLAGAIGATPAVHRGVIAVATLGGKLYGLSLADGSVEWQQDFGGTNYGSPTLAKSASTGMFDSIVVPAAFPANALDRLDIATGALTWQTAPGVIAGIPYSSPAIVGAQTITGMTGGRYQSFDLETGAVGWTFDAAGDVFLSSPLVDGGRVYLFPGDQNASLYAVNASDGSSISGYPLAIPDPDPIVGAPMFGNGPATSSPMIVDGIVVVQLRRGYLIAQPGRVPAKVFLREYVVGIDPSVPRVLWQHAVGATMVDNTNGVPELQTCPTPAGFGDGAGSYVAVSSTIEARVSVLDAATGQELWGAALSAPGRSSPVLSNAQLFVGTDGGVLHAFSADSNHAPLPPTSLAVLGTNVVSWTGAVDPDGDALSYWVRVDKDGDSEPTPDVHSDVGQTQLAIALQPAAAYTVSVRSQDSNGALSVWSPSRRLVTPSTMSPPPSTMSNGDSVTPVVSPAADETGSPPASTPEPPPENEPTTIAATSQDQPSGAGCSVAGSGSPAAGVFLGLAFCFFGVTARRRRGERHGLTGRRSTRMRALRRGRGGATSAALTIALAGFAAAVPARAAVVVWAGGSGVWSTAGNWVGGAAPTSSDVATFSGWAPLPRTAWVATASATNTGDTVTNAIDGKAAGRWSTGAGQTIGQWFKVDMGSAQTFDGITVDAGTNTNDYPGGFDVYVSNDDVNYGSSVGSVTGTSALVSLAFTAQTARYVKIVMNTNSNSAHWWSISELNVFGASGGTLLSRSAWSATATATDGTNVAANALDNTTTTFWRTGANQIAPQWIKFDMQSAQTFTQVTIDASADTNDYPRGYAIYAYNTDDGLHDGNAVATGVGAAALVTVTFTAQTARYLKIVQTATFTAQWWSVHEVNVLNGATTLSRAAWVASASLNTTTASSAIDGSSGTRWTTGTGQVAPQWFKVDMQSARTFTQMRLDAGSRTNEYPQAFAVYAYNTDDGLHDGNPIYSGTSAVEVTDILFASQTARFVKVLITGAAANSWSIAELTVYGTPVASAVQASVTIAGMVLAEAVTVTQAAGVTMTVTGNYAQSAGTFVGGTGATSFQGSTFGLTGGTFTAGSGGVTIAGAATISGGSVTMGAGTEALQSTLAVTGGTFTAGSGPVTTTGAATISGGGIINGGTSSNLSFGSTLAIGNGTAGTFNANAAVVHFTGAVTLQNGGAFNGNTGSGTFSAAPILTSGTFTVGDAGSSGRWTFTQPTTFSWGVTLAFPSSGGELSVSPTMTLTLNGPVTSSVGASSAPPKIDCNGCAAGQGIAIAFGATAQPEHQRARARQLGRQTGVSIASGATYTLARSGLKFQNNVGGVGSTHLAITLGTALINVPGCYFDTTAAHNVELYGTRACRRGAARDIRVSERRRSTAGREGEARPRTAIAMTTTSATTRRRGPTTAPSSSGWPRARPTRRASPSVSRRRPSTGTRSRLRRSTRRTGTPARAPDVVWLRNSDGTAAYSYSVPRPAEISSEPRLGHGERGDRRRRRQRRRQPDGHRRPRRLPRDVDGAHHQAHRQRLDVGPAGVGAVGLGLHEHEHRDDLRRR